MAYCFWGDFMSKDSIYFTIAETNGKHKMKNAKADISAMAGVLSVGVNDETHVLAVDFDNTGVKKSELQRKLKKLGYSISAEHGEEHIM